ncbi:MAG: phage holin family protein [Actinomycetota bacterium]
MAQDTQRTTDSATRSRADGDDVRSTPELIKAVAGDTATLVRKEVELARQEIVEALVARAKAAGALGAAGAMGLFACLFLSVAGALALAIVLPAWAAFLIVAGVFLVLAGGAAAFGVFRMKRPPMAPEETKRTVKEDVEWAKTQLRR